MNASKHKKLTYKKRFFLNAIEFMSENQLRKLDQKVNFFPLGNLKINPTLETKSRSRFVRPFHFCSSIEELAFL